MRTTDTLIIGAGSTGCRLAKAYQSRVTKTTCIFSFQDQEPFTAPEVILRDAPARAIIVAGLGGNAGSHFAPEIARHAKENGRVFAVVTLRDSFLRKRIARKELLRRKLYQL